jgi:hypothetical protein
MHRTRKSLAVVRADAFLCYPVQYFTGLLRSRSNSCRFIHAVLVSLGPNLGPKLSLLGLGALAWAVVVGLIACAASCLRNRVREFKSRRSDQKPA